MGPVREKLQSWVLFGLKPSLRPPRAAMKENGSPRPSPLLDSFSWSFLNAWKRLTSCEPIHSLPKTPSLEGWHCTDLTRRRQDSQVSRNCLLLLLAYKPDLEDDMSISSSAEVWDKSCAVTDLCLHLHRCTVKMFERTMALLVAQERPRWLNLSILSQGENQTPRSSCGLERLIWPYSGHCAEMLQGEEERM